MEEFTNDEWNRYFNKKKQTEKAPTEFFLQEVNKKDNLKCLDIGCGVGLECLYLLQQNCQVDAVDPIIPVRYMEEHMQYPKFRFLSGSIEDPNILNSLDDDYDLIISLSSLPFLPTKLDGIKNIIDEIAKRLKVGGQFICSFLGYNHEWNKVRDAVFLSMDEIKDLLQSFTINNTYTMSKMYDRGDGPIHIEIHYLSTTLQNCK